MPETENRLLRPLRKASPPKKGVFGDLLLRTIREPDLAYDLALTYESLESTTRKKLVETIVVDARAEGIDISALLLALLSVERDARLARLIATNVTVEGNKALAPSCSTKSLRAGDERTGGVVIVRPLYASFIDAYALAWNSQEGITHVLYEPIASNADSVHYAKLLPADLSFDEAPVAYTVALVTKVLWNQVKHFGPLSVQLKGFADLFLGQSFTQHGPL